MEIKCKYHALVENSPVGMFISQYSKIVYSNPALAQMFNKPASELIGASVAALFLPAHQEQIQKLVNAPSNNNSCDLHLNTDKKLVVELSIAPISYNGKNASLGTASNITNRKLEQERIHELTENLQETVTKLQNAQQKLIDNEKMRVIGEMTSGIAHDFNNALSPIAGYSQLLIKYPEMRNNKELVAQYLENIHVAARDASDIIGRLREFYRRREDIQKMVRIDLNELVKQSIRLTKPKWHNEKLRKGNKINIVTNFQKIPTVYGVKSELREMMTNLIFNAAEAFSEEGEITFKTYSQGAQVALEISDNGIGMSEDVQQRCWEAFFSTKGEYGTGLGLAMVSSIVQRHQANISLESKHEKGTKFTILFSLPVEEHTEVVDKAYEAVSQPLRAMVVDDDPVNLDIIHSCLTKDGHSVTIVNNSKDGLNTFKSDKFDVVITDKAMPGIDGEQLAIKIRQISPDIDIILMTGFVDINVEITQPENIDFILSKPLDLDVLCGVLGQISQKLYGQASAKPQQALVTSDLIFPPQTELQKILDMVDSGYLTGLEKCLEKIKAKDNNYSLFVKRVQKFVDDFEFEKITNFISHHYS